MGSLQLGAQNIEVGAKKKVQQGAFSTALGTYNGDDIVFFSEAHDIWIFQEFYDAVGIPR